MSALLHTLIFTAQLLRTGATATAQPCSWITPVNRPGNMRVADMIVQQPRLLREENEAQQDGEGAAAIGPQEVEQAAPLSVRPRKRRAAVAVVDYRPVDRGSIQEELAYRAEAIDMIAGGPPSVAQMMFEKANELLL